MKQKQQLSFRKQMKQSMADLCSIMRHGQSPSGDGRFTTRSLEVASPSTYDAKSVRHTRDQLNVSQAVFAEMLGVSGALVRAWELGTRVPSPLARRLLDHMRADPRRFAALVRSVEPQSRGRRSRKVA
jgi:DNA-binding transcriptional regulator YiaG